jgi:Fic-DOC domain mobile mystery protein B
MTKLKVSFPSGATPIAPDELIDLIPDYISTMEELNQLEQSNIADAFVWAGKQSLDDLLTATFLFKLHGKMFDRVWKWAGKMRNSNKNIGVMKEQILNHLGLLLSNTDHWIKAGTFPRDEIAVRFHHQLVQIHVFPNGNGRHARLMTDLLLQKLGSPKFSWGSTGAHMPLDVEGKTRTQYIEALQAADQNNFTPLLQFSRS